MCVRFNVLDLFKEREVEEALRILELVCEGKVVVVEDHHESPSFDLLRLFEFPLLSFDKVFVLLVWIFWELDGAMLEVHVEHLELFLHSTRTGRDCQGIFQRICPFSATRAEPFEGSLDTSNLSMRRSEAQQQWGGDSGNQEVRGGTCE